MNAVLQVDHISHHEMQVPVLSYLVNLAYITTGEDTRLDVSFHPPDLAQGHNQGLFLLVVLAPGVVVCLQQRVMEVVGLSEIQVEILTDRAQQQAQGFPTREMKITSVKRRETILMEYTEKTRGHRTGGSRSIVVMMLSESPGDGYQEERVLRIRWKKTTPQTGRHNPCKHQTTQESPPKVQKGH